jgi:hypothetical protein
LRFGPATKSSLAASGKRASRLCSVFLEDFPLLGDFDHSRLAEGTAQEILEPALEPFGIFRFHSDTLVHTETRVLPTANISITSEEAVELGLEVDP